MYDENLIFKRYPELTECKDTMYAAFEILKDCVKNGGKILLYHKGFCLANAKEQAYAQRNRKQAGNVFMKRSHHYQGQQGNDVCHI